MQIKAIVIEDEPLALKKLVGFINRLDYLVLLQAFDNAIDAIGFLKNNTVDLIFLDIQMEEFTGIQFLETVQHRPKVIVTTAYDKYALKGYELDLTDYLLKPYTFERFVKAVERVVAYYSQLTTALGSDYVFIKTEYRLEKVKLSEILYIEGMSEYLRIVSADRKIMTKLNFREIEEKLPKNNFVRVHKSFLVALDKIENVERNRIKISDMHIPVSDTYRGNFYEKIGIDK